MATIKWIWIWKPEFYLDGGEDEAAWLKPGFGGEAFMGTCHPDTESGDLVVLYRTKPKMDVAYLLRTTSPAIVNENWRPERGADGDWTYMAEYEVVARIQPPVALSELRSCRDLEDFGALRRNMWGSFFRVEARHSQAIWKLFEGRLPRDIKSMIRRRKRIEGLPLESELEAAMVRKLPVVSRMLGLDLELWEGLGGVKGRQLPCSDAGGRLDLLCEDRKNGGLVLLELKVVKAGVETFGQICSYLGWVKKHLGEGRNVEGVVVADGMDARFHSALAAGLDIRFCDARAVARKLGLLK